MKDRAGKSNGGVEALAVGITVRTNERDRPHRRRITRQRIDHHRIGMLRRSAAKRRLNEQTPMVALRDDHDGNPPLIRDRGADPLEFFAPIAIETLERRRVLRQRAVAAFHQKRHMRSFVKGRAGAGPSQQRAGRLDGGGADGAGVGAVQTRPRSRRKRARFRSQLGKALRELRDQSLRSHTLDFNGLAPDGVEALVSHAALARPVQRGVGDDPAFIQRNHHRRRIGARVEVGLRH